MDRLNHTAVPGPSTPSRREQLSSVVIKRKDDHAIEIDMLKAHGRDEVLQFGIDFAAGLLFPGIKRALCRHPLLVATPSLSGQTVQFPRMRLSRCS